MGEVAQTSDDAASVQRYITDLLLNDPLRRSALELVASCPLPSPLIAAGFVRDSVWDDLHGHGACRPTGDVDVVFHDTTDVDTDRDEGAELWLRERCPDLAWSVKNQARMHRRNADAPYASVSDAMRHWPETATAIAVALTPEGGITIEAPFGTGDLIGLRLRPTPAFVTGRRRTFDERVAAKRWLSRYPRLIVA